jgi:hypothetical protein
MNKKFKKTIGSMTFKSFESWVRFILGMVKMSDEYLLSVPDDELYKHKDYIKCDLKYINRILKHIELNNKKGIDIK